MAVVINQFEAVGDAPEARKGEAQGAAPAKPDAAALAPLLRRIAVRDRRLKAH